METVRTHITTWRTCHGSKWSSKKQDSEDVAHQTHALGGEGSCRSQQEEVHRDDCNQGCRHGYIPFQPVLNKTKDGNTIISANSSKQHTGESFV